MTPQLQNQLVSTRQAAEIIGCDISQIRVLLRKEKAGPFPGAVVVETDTNPTGKRWYIPLKQVMDYASRPQSHGYPRGKKRG